MENHKTITLKDEDRMATIPLIAHELDMAKLTRIIHLLVLIIVLLLGYIAYDSYQDSQYDYSDVIIDTQDGGNANYLKAGANGVINDAKNNSPREDTEEQEKAAQDKDTHLYKSETRTRGDQTMNTKPFENLSRPEIEQLIDDWVICKRNAKRNGEILKMALLDGISQERIAEEFGLSTRQVQNAIKSALHQLLQHLQVTHRNYL